MLRVSLLTLLLGSALSSNATNTVVNDQGCTTGVGSLDVDLPSANKSQTKDETKPKGEARAKEEEFHDVLDDPYWEPPEFDNYQDEAQYYGPFHDVLDDPYWVPPEFDNYQDEAQYYGPLDRFWRHSAKAKTLMLGDVDYYPAMEQCMNEHLTVEEWEEIRQPQNLDRRVGQRFIDPEGYGPVHLVEIQNAMSPIHAKAVRALNVCVRKNISQLYEKRPMYQVYQVEETADDSVKEEMGGNNPTHLNSIIGIFLPDVVKEQYKTLEMAYHYAGWQAMVVRDEIMGKFRANDDGTQAAFAPHYGAGMRACEYLNYEGFSRLMEHRDGYATSVVLNVMLSDADDYEGGAFYIKDEEEEGRYQSIKPDKYSALAFLGGTFEHGVHLIEGGKREALSTEFWYYPDLPFGVNLCAAEFRNVEEYIRQCNEVQRNVETGDFDYDIPCHLEFPSGSIYGVCHSHTGTKKETNVYEDTQQQQQEANPQDHDEF